MVKKLVLTLSFCLALACPAWAQVLAQPETGSARKDIPIIEVVAPRSAPGSELKAPVAKTGADLRLERAAADPARFAASAKAEDKAMALRLGSFSAEFQASSDSALDRRLDTRPILLGDQAASSPYAWDSRLDDTDQQGGFVAFKWRASRNGGVTLGGGFTRSSTAYTAGASVSQGSLVRSGGALTSNGRGSEANSSADISGRWGAFLAVPYQLGKNVGLSPEVSYYYGDVNDSGRDAANEWVMGLRFTFGF